MGFFNLNYYIMKKIKLLGFIAVLLFLAQSCTSEDDLDQTRTLTIVNEDLTFNIAEGWNGIPFKVVDGNGIDVTFETKIFVNGEFHLGHYFVLPPEDTTIEVYAELDGITSETHKVVFTYREIAGLCDLSWYPKVVLK